ncbi:MAG: hypothetical protein JXA42_02850, partial [Anaerolineales bacterium]|nr:hypothetical protein [Anaerolineales bacterium]
TSGYFHFSNHFRSLIPGPSSLIQTGLLFNYDIAGQTPFSMGLWQAVFTAVGFFCVLYHFLSRTLVKQPDPAMNNQESQNIQPLAWFSLITLVISTLMILSISSPLWKSIPLLPMVQFPWRFLSIQALACALLLGEIPQIVSIPGQSNRKRRMAWGLGMVSIIVLIGASALVGLKPDFISLTEADVTPVRLELYEWFSGNVGTTIRYEYLPSAVVPRLYTSEGVIQGEPVKAGILSGEATAELLKKQTGWEAWNVDVYSESAVIVFPTLYWPGWQARVGGEQAIFEPATSQGKMSLNLPAGRHRVILSLGRTPLRLAAELISAGSLLFCLVLLLKRSLPLKGAEIKRTTLLTVIGVVCIIVFVFFILHLNPGEPATLNDLTWDFDQQAYLHHNPDGIEFENGAVLQAYFYDDSADNKIIQSLPRQVAVRWKEIPGKGQVLEMALVHPAEVVQNVSYTMASVQQTIMGNETIVNLPLLESVPPGPLLIRLRLIDSDGELIPALTSSGNRRGDLYLRPVWAEPPLPVDSSCSDICLDRVSTEQITPENLQAVLQWVVADRIPANYQIALRLTDENGYEWAALDTQPGYGFYPTGAWQPNTTFTDRMTLELPYGIPPGDYSLSVSLYEVATLESVWGPETFSVKIEQYAPYDGGLLEHQFPAGLEAAVIDAPEAIAQGNWLSFSVLWATTEQIDKAPNLLWELTGEHGAAMIQVDMIDTGPSGSMNLNNYSALLDPLAPPGMYQLRLSLIDPDTNAVLGEYWDAACIRVIEQPRSFTLPEMDTELDVDFGRMIRLEGYRLDRSDRQLSLTLVWQALQDFPAPYTVFVHLYDPAAETIVAQHDAMPQGNTYPTSRWITGEVVEDPVTLSLDGIAPGRYRLAVGLYFPEGEDFIRISAVDAFGNIFPGDRVTLPDIIEIP